MAQSLAGIRGPLDTQISWVAGGDDQPSRAFPFRYVAPGLYELRGMLVYSCTSTANTQYVSLQINTDAGGVTVDRYGIGLYGSGMPNPTYTLNSTIALTSASSLTTYSGALPSATSLQAVSVQGHLRVTVGGNVRMNWYASYSTTLYTTIRVGTFTNLRRIT